MATLQANDQPSLLPDQGQQGTDPFLSATAGANHHGRFSHFDNQLFALGPATSPEQAKRALEAHLAETEKRIQEASTLGTSLLQQRKDLEKRLKDVEKQQGEADITPELRQKLVEIEREYNEVGRESARAFLPKSRVSSSEMGGSPFAGDKRSLSPSKFESRASDSPSKLNVPSRKQRNQPSNRVHDIEFATEISTSLLGQVRHLQTLLSEKEDMLKTVTLEKSRLEVEAEGFSQRLRSLDDSEQRYKDENWNLETQIQEHLANLKDAKDLAARLEQDKRLLSSEKSAAQKELDEIKLSHAKLTDQHVAAVKHHDVELGSIKRSITQAETERGTLQRKVEDLTGQNTELARAIAHQRGRLDNRDQVRNVNEDDFDNQNDNHTPDGSPPPSPVKVTPRHSMLESETLKSSLSHAHKMIQNLKGNIHREKTEKLELKRMLQDARDELDARRNDVFTGSGKKAKRSVSKDFKKPAKPTHLGGARNVKHEVIEDTNWEDDTHDASPLPRVAGRLGLASGPTLLSPKSKNSSDQCDTGHDTSPGGSDAFETANERATETEGFHTGVEEMSDDLTETEGDAKSTRTKPMALSLHHRNQSFQSTASASDDYQEEVQTPTGSQAPRLRMKGSRNMKGRARAVSQASQMSDVTNSPASNISRSRDGTPMAGQSLFAELADLGSDDEDSVDGTPNSFGRFGSGHTTPANSRPSTARKSVVLGTAIPPVPKLPMVDSGMMTDLWEPEPKVVLVPSAELQNASLSIAHTLPAFEEPPREVEESEMLEPQADAPELENHLQVLATPLVSDAGDTSTETQARAPVVDSASQGDEGRDLSAIADSRHASVVSNYQDVASQWEESEDADDKSLATAMPSPATPSPATAAPLTISSIVSEEVQPIVVAEPAQVESAVPEVEPLHFSAIQWVATSPIAPPSPVKDAFMVPRGVVEQSTPTRKRSSMVSRSAGAVQDTPLKDPSVVLSNVGTEQDGPTKESVVSRSSAAEQTRPQTPKSGFIESVFGSWKSKTPSSPNIAEDETSQSFDHPLPSQRALGSISGNTNERAEMSRKATSDESSQTALTSHQLDEMLKSNRQGVAAEFPPSSAGSRGKAADVFTDSPASERPSSVGNASIMSSHPPLPQDARKVIAAAEKRSGSSSGNPAVMGPPMISASAMRAHNGFRPRTSSSIVGSPASVKNGVTALPPRMLSGPGERSRHSSISSFASEVDTRFNLNSHGMPMLPEGIEPITDPRMINAITQTMIGEYLWKYTRKAGRGSLSENRHQRYFWVHPYTRTLYWSDRDPAAAGRQELKAKSAAIVAVRVVTDDNISPPGLHRKSLIIMTPSRPVKITCSTATRHEVWFNALSYLLLRTGEDAAQDNVEVVGALTSEDVEDFNPRSGSRAGGASVSSYNSRPNYDSPAGKAYRQPSLHQPQLMASPGTKPQASTISRLSTYLKPGQMQGSFRSRHSASAASVTSSFYEADQAHDSAEDLREQILQQERESDRLENVRACCDGKHDVGHLHHHPSRPGGKARVSSYSTSGSRGPSRMSRHAD